MKKVILISLISILCFFTYSFGQIRVQDDGSLSVGTTNTSAWANTRLYVANYGETKGMIYAYEGNDAILWTVNMHYAFGLGVGNSDDPKGYILGNINQPEKIMTFLPNKNVGIGIENPDEKLVVNGIIKCRELRFFEEESRKNLSREINIAKLLSLNPISFNYNTSINNNQEMHANNYDSVFSDTYGRERIHFGFNDNELEELFPDLIYISSNGAKGIDYFSFIPLLTKAYQEQQILIDELIKEIKSKETAHPLTNPYIDEIDSRNILFQNAPNPFSESTEIKFFLEPFNKSAFIFIYNMEGFQIKKISINSSGNGSITINGGEFKAGMYMYSLIVDNHLICTKTMVLTD